MSVAVFAVAGEERDLSLIDAVTTGANQVGIAVVHSIGKKLVAGVSHMAA